MPLQLPCTLVQVGDGNYRIVDAVGRVLISTAFRPVTEDEAQAILGAINASDELADRLENDPIVD